MSVASFPSPPAPLVPAQSTRLPASVMAAALARLLEDADSALDHDLRGTNTSIARAANLLGQARLYLPMQNLPAPRSILPGGLAVWQAKRVLAEIEARLDASIRVAELAATVRLSSSYFCRAFKMSFGLPPHAYVMQMRVERAKRLMLESATPLAEIALSCGLSDQAHLSRMFRQIAGESPNAWRRRHAQAT